MHDVVKVFGVITAIIGLLLILYGFKDRDLPAFVGMLWIGGPAIVAGAILFCFGAIVEHLIAIRIAAERQVEIFDRLGKPK